jgi:hypothetical protein
VPIVLKSGSLNLLEPSGPVKACNGIALRFYIRYLGVSSVVFGSNVLLELPMHHSAVIGEEGKFYVYVGNIGSVCVNVNLVTGRPTKCEKSN